MHDLIVIGAGPGGYTAALEAGRRGLKTALVEREEIGGTCLNRGCIPTKMLLGATAAVDELAAQERLKNAKGQIAPDLHNLQTRKDRYLAATRKAMTQALKQADVTLIAGDARFTAPDALEVRTMSETLHLPFKHCVLATGARPFAFPGMEPDQDRVLDSTAALELKNRPESLIIVGGGYIGLEMGQIFARFGTPITVVDAADRLAPQEDPEVSRELERIFGRKGWKILTGAKVDSLVSEGGQAELTLSSGEILHADKALVAVGRRPNTEHLDLGAAKIATMPAGFVRTDDYLRASARISAVGDVNGHYQLAHAAEHQAHYVIRRLTGETGEAFDPGVVPSCIYGSVETLRAGRLETELAAEGAPVRISRAMLAANPIAQAYGAPQGFIKIVWVEDRVAGIVGVGHGVASLTTLAAVMVRQGWTMRDVDQTIFPHPSLDEALLAALRVPPTEP